MQPSSWHGVTTVVMGNCGVGFAPCRPDDHDRLIRLMEGVEDIPFPVLSEGLPWNWESYPDYLDALSAPRLRYRHRQPAAARGRCASSSWASAVRGASRPPPPTSPPWPRSPERAARGRGPRLHHLAHPQPPHQRRRSRPRPSPPARTSWPASPSASRPPARACCRWSPTSPTPRPSSPCCAASSSARAGRCPSPWCRARIDPTAYKTLLAVLEDAAAAGLPMAAQVAARAVGVLLGLELTVNPVQPVPDLPRDRRRCRLPSGWRGCATRNSAPACWPTAPHEGARRMPTNWGRMHLMGGEPDYEPTAETTVAARRRAAAASRRKKWPSITCSKTADAACSMCRSSTTPRAPSTPPAP